MVLEVQSSVMPSMITVGHWGLATEKPAPSWAMPTRSAAGRACACDQLVNPKMQAKQPEMESPSDDPLFPGDGWIDIHDHVAGTGPADRRRRPARCPVAAAGLSLAGPPHPRVAAAGAFSR